MTDGMPCPACRIPLVMSDRQGVEIDYCPQCRGVWLDRGELDKIIERSGRDAPQARPAAQPLSPNYGQAHPKRRKSFLEELFD
jgi:Zn-finger nucleic acid-binding protein